MRVPWLRRRRDEEEGRSAADEALEISEQQHERARQRKHEFGRLARRMREVRAHNHLAEAFRDAFGEGR